MDLEMKVSHLLWGTILFVISFTALIYTVAPIENILGCYVLGEGGIAGIDELFDLNRTTNVCMPEQNIMRTILLLILLIPAIRFLAPRVIALVRVSPLGRWVESNIGMTSDDDSDEQ